MLKIVASTSMLPVQTGDEAARDRLFAMLYNELRRMAQRELRRGGEREKVDASSGHPEQLRGFAE